jgi:hypothetical protein
MLGFTIQNILIAKQEATDGGEKRTESDIVVAE